jgi:hypothetical protein
MAVLAGVFVPAARRSSPSACLEGARSAASELQGLAGAPGTEVPGGAGCGRGSLKIFLTAETNQMADARRAPNVASSRPVVAGTVARKYSFLYASNARQKLIDAGQ